MKEVKSPKKPLLYYYGITILVILLFNLIVTPMMLKNQVTEVDYGTFMSIIAGSLYFYFTMIVNIIGIVLGFIMVFFPTVSLLSVSYIVGANLIIFGIDCLVMALGKPGSR